MTDVARAAAMIGLVAASSGRPADALTPKLTASQSARAVADGATLATAGQGYPMSQYRLWAAQDTLSIAPGQGALDALVIATPFERLRYESYLNGYQHKRISPRDVGENVRTYADTVEFILFVHSPGSEQRDFLNHIGHAAVTLAGGGSLPAPVYDRFGPSLDFYNVKGRGRELRWIGYVGARFDLRHVSATARTLRGTLSFVDDEGKHYRFPFDLSRYK